jgi:hypothetical protein
MGRNTVFPWNMVPLKNPFSLTQSEGTKITTNIYVETAVTERDLLVIKVYSNIDGKVCCVFYVCDW